MGYFRNQVLVYGLFSIGVGVVFSVFAYSVFYLVNRNKERWMVDIKSNRFVLHGKDNISIWVDTVDRRIAESGLKLKTKSIILFNMLIAIGAFFMSLKLFNNFVASVFFGAIFFIIPEYILFLYESKREMKIEDQMVVAIRIFVSEFLKTKNIEKSFSEVSTKVPDPVGGYFADAYMDILTGHTFNSAVARLATRVNNEYWKMFIQLIFQLKTDSHVIALFTDLVSRIERSIELSRSNEASLGGERVLALIMSLLPVPIYYFMANIVPETVTFVVDTVVGRILITASFLSIFLFVFLDKLLRRVD